MKKLPIITEEEKKRILFLHSNNNKVLNENLEFLTKLKDAFIKLLSGEKTVGKNIFDKLSSILGIDDEKLDDKLNDFPELKTKVKSNYFKYGDDEKDEKDQNIEVMSKVDYSKGNFDTKQKNNIKYLISFMEKKGITDPYAQIGILSVIGKECRFIPKSEVDYSSTSNSRIKKIFKNARKLDDSKLSSLKKDPVKFFNLVYGGRNGNEKNEGYKYRGRGFNQLTFKGNYKKYGDLVGENLVNNPDNVNYPETAAKVAVAFFTKGKSGSAFPKFKSKEDAAGYFADINSGGGSSSHRSRAVEYSKYFNTK